MMLLKLGSKGENVRILQRFLDIDVDGDFGIETKKEVKKYQKDNHLTDDGIVGPDTWESMGLLTTDIKENSDIYYNNISYLPENEYYHGPYEKHWLFLHHTAGWNNPYKTITNWANDSRGKIATEFVIGGQSIKGNDDKHDGTLVKCMPDGGFGWHLGIGNIFHKETIGVEMCNFGQLTKGGYKKQGKWITKDLDKYYTYVGVESNIEQICFIDKKFRGYDVWHKYSDNQILSLKELIKNISKKYNIDPRKGIIELIKSKGAHEAFDFCNINYVKSNPGIWLHSNVRKDKFDLSPQPKLIDMLLSL